MKRLLYSLDIWNILRQFDTFYGHLLIYVVASWYIFPCFGKLCREKSGNPSSMVKRLILFMPVRLTGRTFASGGRRFVVEKTRRL
jgi:hypothetical protein